MSPFYFNALSSFYFNKLEVISADYFAITVNNFQNLMYDRHNVMHQQKDMRMHVYVKVSFDTYILE